MPASPKPSLHDGVCLRQAEVKATPVGWCEFLMAAAKRYTAEQIVAELREAEKLQGQGVTVPGGLQEAPGERADVLQVA